MSAMEDDLRQRIIELEAQLLTAHEDIESMRAQIERDPRPEKENELYVLDRRVTLSEAKNKGTLCWPNASALFYFY